MKLQDAFARAVAALEYAAPSSPGHRCGPEAGCDLACEEYAGWCGAMAALLEVQAAVPELLAVAKACLLFHASGPWTVERAAEWEAHLQPILGDEPFGATTKALCDAARAALAKAGA